MLERAASADRLEVDLGTGDGAQVYRSARAHPCAFFIGIDANAHALADRSRRAAAKPARGGAPNALYVRAGVEHLPDELADLADRVTVAFPWGSLLRAVVMPDPAVLAGIRRVCRSGATLDIAGAFFLERELASASERGIASFDARHLDGVLVAAYAAAGFSVTARPCPRENLDAFATTWGKKLLLDRERRFFRICGTAQ